MTDEEARARLLAIQAEMNLEFPRVGAVQRVVLDRLSQSLPDGVPFVQVLHAIDNDPRSATEHGASNRARAALRVMELVGLIEFAPSPAGGSVRHVVLAQRGHNALRMLRISTKN